MARLLDRPDAVAQHPAAVGQFVKILDALRKRPARKGPVGGGADDEPVVAG